VVGVVTAGAYGAFYSETNASSVVTNAYYSGGIWNYRSTNPATRFDSYNGDHYFYTAPSGTAGAEVTFTERARLTSTGLNSTVIGATTPAAGSFTTLSATGNVGMLKAGGGQFLSGTDSTSGYELGYLQFNAENVTLNATGGAAGTSSKLRFITGGVERVAITSAGVLDLPIGQIQFPATQNASSDPNTLDDYEEGTWTPALNGSITTPTYTLQTGIYTKIGNTVTIAGRITISAGTPTGTSVGLTGVPFAPRASTGDIVVGNAIVRVSNASGDKNVRFWLEASSTVAYLQYSEASGVTGFTGTQLGATGSFAFSCTYQV
jgi:hypothetical protein